MWFLYALPAAVLWGGVDLFYKKGSVREDRFSDVNIVVAVGFVILQQKLGQTEETFAIKDNLGYE